MQVFLISKWVKQSIYGDQGVNYQCWTLATTSRSQKVVACRVVANFSNFVALSLSRRISVASLRQQTDYKLKIEICCDSSVGRYFCYFTGSIASSGSASDLPSSNSNLASFVEQYMHFKIQ